ncbi:MAG: protease inhibitor I42 family protein [Candidatus Manganitrophaceae bacterium]
MAETQAEVKKVHAKIGEPFHIRIWEDRTRGSRYVPAFDPTAFNLISDEYERMRHVRTNDIGMHCFEFVPMVSGSYLVEFESRYGWKFSADDRLIYEVEVKGT